MLLTNLIPPKSQQIKEALSVFNRFLEEPHKDPNERLELLIEGGYGCGKSSIGGGMILKACEERGDCGICITKSARDSVDWNLDNVKWCIEKLGIPSNRYSISIQAKRITLNNYNSQTNIYFKGIDDGLQSIGWQTRGIKNNRYVWIENAEELTSINEYVDTINELQLKVNPIVVLTYRPNKNNNHWLNRYAAEIHKKNGKDNRWVFKPCYLDMEEAMLGESFFQRAEMLRIHDPRVFVHEYLGIPVEG